jgi:hypothetical protein
MTEKENQLLIEHARSIAEILYKNAPVEELTSVRVDRRSSTQSNAATCNAYCWGFFIRNVTVESTGHKREIKRIIGKLSVTSSQAQKLELRPHSQLSPYLEAYCLRASASLSYEPAAEDVKYATGIEVPKSVQQRLVHRQDFEFTEVQTTVEEVTLDRGNIRIRTPIGQQCDWKGYSSVRLHNLQAIAASFQENSIVINWVNNQSACSYTHLSWRRTRRESGILSVSLPENMSDVKYLIGSI